MKINRILALLLAAVMLLSIFTGCNTVEPNVTDPSGSIENTADPTDGTDSTSGTTDTTTGTEDPTGTTGSDPAGNETISGTENTEPSNPSGDTTDSTACAHKWSAWKTTVATCTADGVKTRNCANCGEKQSEAIPATGHSYGSWSTTKSATCDTNGVKSRKCATCGNTETQTIAASGHTWDSGKVTTTPTSCSDMGIKTYTCTACGKTKTEQIKGNHTFGSWQYEEYTYLQDGVSRVSHRKVRTCTKCGYKETDGTAEHYCAKGSVNHTVTTVKEGTCTTKATMRSTCKICGWYLEYEGKKGSHTIKTETRHLTDYGDYTNELDAEIQTCTTCGASDVVYIKGEGWSDYNRYEAAIAIYGGAAYSLEHPEYQTVKRDFVRDSDGYVKQFTLYWWYNGTQYSQVIKCDKASLIAWFAEYGLDGTADGVKFQIKTTTSATPGAVSWTG